MRRAVRAPPVEPVPAGPAPIKSGTLQLAARSLKVTVVLPPAQLAGLDVPPGPHLHFAIMIDGRRVTGQFNAKTLRRTVATIAEHRPENVAVIVQGTLASDRIEAAGISAQMKGPRPGA
jgi:hypothetical protein